MIPEFRGTNAEVTLDLRLVVKDRILHLVGACVVVNDEALKIFRTLIHNLAEELKVGEGCTEVIKDTLTVRDLRLTENEHIVHVCTEHWRNTERLLHRDQEEHFLVATVQEDVTNVLVVNPRIVVQAVIQNQERAGIQLLPRHHCRRRATPHTACRIFHIGDLLCNNLLALYEVVDNGWILLAVNEERRNDLSVEAVGLLRTADHCTDWDILVMLEQVLDERGLTRTTATNENANGVLGDHFHIKLPKIHCLSRQ